ncbi:MAG: hypothetical protein ACKOAD_01530 [Gammaproteobacteria bacterium]
MEVKLLRLLGLWALALFSFSLLGCASHRATKATEANELELKRQEENQLQNERREAIEREQFLMWEEMRK